MDRSVLFPADRGGGGGQNLNLRHQIGTGVCLCSEWFYSGVFILEGTGRLCEGG